jgi:cation:H+ antiporter
MMDSPLVSTFLLFASILLLWKGADLVVHTAAHIAHRHGLSDLVIGMTVVALGTSAPEIVVTLVAAVKDQPDIALGNVVGSNIFNMGFILGATALMGSVATPRFLTSRDTPMLLIATVLLLGIVWDLSLARWEGLAMLLLFFAYLFYVFQRDEGPVEEHEVPPGTGTVRDFPLLAVGLAFVVGGGHLLVVSASELATAVGIPTWAIAVTIVAAGTSAPECATCIMAAMRGRHSMAAGNLVGSDLFNILGVLGLAAVSHPMAVDPVARGSVGLMVVMVTMAMLFMWTGWRLNRTEGLVLIFFALLRWGRDVAFVD